MCRLATLGPLLIVDCDALGNFVTAHVNTIHPRALMATLEVIESIRRAQTKTAVMLFAGGLGMRQIHLGLGEGEVDGLCGAPRNVACEQEDNRRLDKIHGVD